MIKLTCDKCGRDCGLNAFVITNELIHNPNPTSYKDRGDINISSTNFQYKLMLCQSCYGELNLPNYFMVKDEGKNAIDRHFINDIKIDDKSCRTCVFARLCKVKRENPEIEYCNAYSFFDYKEKNNG